MEWININDRLPEINQPVLIYEKWIDCKSELFTGKFDGKNWIAFKNNIQTSCTTYCYGGMPESEVYNEHVTHWMPLPELPKFTNPTPEQ